MKESTASTKHAWTPGSSSCRVRAPFAGKTSSPWRTLSLVGQMTAMGAGVRRSKKAEANTCIHLTNIMALIDFHDTSVLRLGDDTEDTMSLTLPTLICPKHPRPPFIPLCKLLLYIISPCFPSSLPPLYLYLIPCLTQTVLSSAHLVDPISALSFASCYYGVSIIAL